MGQDRGMILWAVSVWSVVLAECCPTGGGDPKTSLQRNGGDVNGSVNTAVVLSPMFHRMSACTYIAYACAHIYTDAHI